ncbi:hypothetical protein CYFUS_006388 [Cystobacter fuscus]|uniref:Uncharacterized protein n=1 Tax=Cystobacter fuscus TaxID=43 RepID=A0A250JCM3_9BACT|nr:hypothetical protein [Cystobacter fuscus]ATB40926.1 hypothetical protein CYFUS_006388 [Cystobacter fuscus]
MATSRLRVTLPWLRLVLTFGALGVMTLLLMQVRLRLHSGAAEPARDTVLWLDPLPPWLPAPTSLDISGRCAPDIRRIELSLSGSPLTTECLSGRFLFQGVALAPGRNVLQFSAGTVPRVTVRSVELLGIVPPRRVLSLRAVAEGALLRVESVFPREQASSLGLLADDTNEALARVFQPVLLNDTPVDHLVRRGPHTPTLTLGASEVTLSKSIPLSRRAYPVFEKLVLRSRDGFPFSRATDEFIIESPGLVPRSVTPLPDSLEGGVGRWKGTGQAPGRATEIRLAFSDEATPSRWVSRLSQQLARLRAALPSFLLTPGPELLLLVVAFCLLAHRLARTTLPAPSPVPNRLVQLFDPELPRTGRTRLLAEWLVAFALVVPLIELLRPLAGPPRRLPPGLWPFGVMLVTLVGTRLVRGRFPAFHSRWGGLLAAPWRASALLLLVTVLLPSPSEHALWGLRLFMVSSLLGLCLAPLVLQPSGRAWSRGEWGWFVLLPGLLVYALAMPALRAQAEASHLPILWEALRSSTALPEVLGHALLLGLLASLASSTEQREPGPMPWVGALLFASHVVGLHDKVGGWALPALLGLALFPTVLLLPPERRKALLAGRDKVLSLRKQWLEELPLTWLQQMHAALEVLGTKFAKGELSLNDYQERASKLEQRIAEVEKNFSFEGTPARDLVFAHGPLAGDWENAKLAMRLGCLFFLPVTLAYTAWGLTQVFSWKGLGFLLIFYTANVLASAALFGFFFSGLRGRTGPRKALWLCLVTLLCLLPSWLEVLSRTNDLVLFVFSMLHSMMIFLLLGLCFDGWVARAAWGDRFRWRTFLGLAGLTTVTASLSLLGASLATTLGSALTGQLSKTVVQFVGMAVGGVTGGEGPVP